MLVDRSGLLTGRGAALLAADALLAALLPAADLAQLLVVEEVAGQADIEDGDAHDELRQRRRHVPGVLRQRAVGGQPAAQADGVAQLEEECEGPDDDVHGRHGRLQQREEHGAVGVVDDEESGQHAVLPRQLGHALQPGERSHGVQQRQEARALHRHPGDAAGDVEAAGHRRLAHAVPADEPLDRADLKAAVKKLGQSHVIRDWSSAETLTAGKMACVTVTMNSQFSRLGGNQSGIRGCDRNAICAGGAGGGGGGGGGEAKRELRKLILLADALRDAGFVSNCLVSAADVSGS